MIEVEHDLAHLRRDLTFGYQNPHSSHSLVAEQVAAKEASNPSTTPRINHCLATLFDSECNLFNMLQPMLQVGIPMPVFPVRIHALNTTIQYARSYANLSGPSTPARY